MSYPNQTNQKDVTSLLSNRSSLPNNILIKPDMSKAEHNIESLLMKERWCLIQIGVDHKSIKLRSLGIYIDDKPH